MRDSNPFLLQQLNATIDIWKESLIYYTDEALRRQPLTGSWSIGQLYLHLITDTLFFIKQINLCLTNNDNVNEEATETGKIMLRENEFPDMKLEGDPSNAHIPQPSGSEELMTRLVYVQQRLNELYLQYQSTKYFGKSKHPGLGYFSAGQWFQFADMHFRHHFRQKKRIDAFLQANHL